MVAVLGRVAAGPPADGSDTVNRTLHGARAAVLALRFGSGAVIRAPWSVGLVYFATLAATLPFAMVVAQTLRHDLDRSLPITAPYVVTPEWWSSYAEHTSGLMRTFLPYVVGVAAPLHNVSVLVEAATVPWMLVFPAAVYLTVSTWAWAVVLRRFIAMGGGAGSARRWYTFRAVLGVNVVMLVALVVVYGAAHVLRMWLPDQAFAGLAWYVMFGVTLAALGLAADYARIIAVASERADIRATLAAALSWMRQHANVVIALFAVAFAAYVVLIALYAFVDVRGGVRVGGWRAIVVAQGYIISRVMVRVVIAAAQVRAIRDA